MQGYERTREALLDAVLPHVAFEGWSPVAFRAALRDAQVEPAAARAACPRGAIDLAVAFHERGDRRMSTKLKGEALEDLRVRERVTRAVRARIEAIGDREAARRAATLFSLPHLVPEGARLVWGTADAIWTACGDTSEDANWYSKRAILAGVYGSSVLYWLGDDSPGSAETWSFLDRRIDDVMQIERVKENVGANRLFRAAFAAPLWALGRVRAPARAPRGDMPGLWPDGEPGQEEAEHPARDPAHDPTHDPGARAEDGPRGEASPEPDAPRGPRLA